MLSAKLTFKAKSLGVRSEGKKVLRVPTLVKLQMLPESVSVLQSCCCHHGAWDMQKVIRLLITQHILHVLSSLFLTSSASEELQAGVRCRGDLSPYNPPPLHIKGKEETGI